MSESLKREILELLDRDIEFRYAVAGYLGLSEVLRRLDTLVEEQARLREEQTRIWSEIYKLWEEVKALREGQEKLWIEVRNLSEGQKKLWEEVADLREGQNKLWEEVKALREDMVAGFRRYDEEIAKLRQDMIEGFKRHDEILEKHSEEIKRLREDMLEGFRRHDEEIAKLRQDMKEGFDLLRRHIGALGSRWGLMAEEAFREGLRGLLEREFGFKIEKWVRYDEPGMVFGYPSKVDIDVAVYDEKIVLIEVKSHIDKEDVYYFKRKTEFYRIQEGREPERLVIVTPYADEEALEVARRLGIEIYTRV